VKLGGGDLIQRCGPIPAEFFVGDWTLKTVERVPGPDGGGEIGIASFTKTAGGGMFKPF
jgi:hypothetical protein